MEKEMTEEEIQAAAYVKLHEDVRALVRGVLLDLLRGYDIEIVNKLQDLTMGTPLFDMRVKQVISNQMQR